MEIPSAGVFETVNMLQSGQVSCFRNAKRFLSEAGFVPGAPHLKNAAFHQRPLVVRGAVLLVTRIDGAHFAQNSG
jgi:hypothetical protein